MATPTSSIPERAAAVATASSTTRPVGDELVRATWLFQAGCALPTLFVLGVMAFAELFEPQIPLYDFITDLSNSLLAAGIIFLVIVQRRVRLDALGAFSFEAAKTVLASAMWLWLFLDALLAHKEYNGSPYYDDERRRRVIRAVIASILLWILFYPPLLYAGWMWFESRGPLRDGERNGEVEAGVGEDTPLLREGS